MTKNLDAILPKSVESEPVTVTISGYDDVSSAQVSGEPLAPSSLGNEYQRSLDEVESWYRGQDGLTIHIPENVVYKPAEIPPSESAKKHKKKGKKQKESKKDLLRRIWDNSEEGETEEVPAVSKPVFPPMIQDRRGYLKEYKLYGILTKNTDLAFMDLICMSEVQTVCILW